MREADHASQTFRRNDFLEDRLLDRFDEREEKHPDEGPAQFVFIPFMTTGGGVEWIGGWFGTGMGRGIALVFTAAGIAGLTVTALARRSRAYRLLASRYE